MSLFFSLIQESAGSSSFDVTVTFNDVRVTKNWILQILDDNRQNFKFSAKMLGSDFVGVFGQI